MNDPEQRDDAFDESSDTDADLVEEDGDPNCPICRAERRILDASGACGHLLIEFDAVTDSLSGPLAAATTAWRDAIEHSLCARAGRRPAAVPESSILANLMARFGETGADSPAANPRAWSHLWMEYLVAVAEDAIWTWPVWSAPEGSPEDAELSLLRVWVDAPGDAVEAVTRILREHALQLGGAPEDGKP